ncbi:Xaa-Pro aminopeptidase [Candidatus Kryptobacter tengchongensis]|nr:Xaa-Pro aminopeptidase [Candidatus Kryptobacter tengchongensis]CUU10551.1 Xaa-Pro aminopeptidase [Candidatus Kryptobacter tengchongensis]
MKIEKIQKTLHEFGLDGWLFYDFHNRDKIGMKILGLSMSGLATRRWFYFIPKEGKPIKLVHRVEPDKLDSLPGEKFYYSGWRELHERLKEILGMPKKIAMQYSPFNSIPYISIVDAGTIELVKSFGHEVVSSADLVQIFEALIDEETIKTHFEAGKLVDETLDEAFEEIRKAVRNGKYKTEYEIQQFILKRFHDKGLTSDEDPPIVGVNDHPANPHFYPTPENTREIKPGDKLLIDLWAKKNQPGAIFYDITWCAFIGDDPPEEYVKIFHIVRDARREALAFLQNRLSKNQDVAGWEVDEVARKYIQERGYGEFFTHRTGHSIGENVHGNGANIDNFETKDLRKLVPGSLFSLEPGVYIPGKMGVRSEVNVYINSEKKALITGREQEELVLIY